MTTMPHLVTCCLIVGSLLLVRAASHRRRDIKHAKAELIATRRSARSQKLSHSHDPLVVVQGEGSYLISDQGQKYLDSRNNVASIGHQHPAWIEAVCDQVRRTNTNARYLHPTRNELVAELCSTLPKHLSVCFLVNSGSEATELALRLAKAKSKRRNVLAVKMGYHGFTNAALDASPYKWEGKERPETLTVIELGQSIDEMISKGDIGCFIVESALSVAGVQFPPHGWLADAFAAVQQRGGVCIADEIQVGLGRLGDWFWGFQRDPLCRPDIVTIGKGIGNGFPVGAVVCTDEVARALDEEAREVFSTFGGNPVACRAAVSVLRTIKDEKLQDNARITGAYLKQKLVKLHSDAIVEVRGSGLFIGIEFISAQMAQNVTKRMYDIHHILTSLDGLGDCVMVVKPPLCWRVPQVNEFVDGLEESLRSIKHEMSRTSS